MKCSICGKNIVLIPSAKERAEKYGGKPSDYTKLFTYHSDCFIKKREKETRDLIRKINQEKKDKRVFFALGADNV